MSARTLQRIIRMNRAELRFRAASAWRRAHERRRIRRAAPSWNRRSLCALIAPSANDEHGMLGAARASAARGDWHTAHSALATHFAGRRSAFPIDAGDVSRVAGEVLARFPDAAADAGARGRAICSGAYDVLGYTGVAWGSPPDWHRDPVHDRRAPAGYWADVPYLDPRFGDHKIIWELNRHQHWLALGRARHLTGDRRYYTEFVRQIDSWLADNPPLVGINWASMLELGFRTLSWLWALPFFAGDGADDRGATWLVDAIVALDAQLQHVEDNLSLYFSPNTHLTGEALALYVCGLALPELAASQRRTALGRSVLLREAERQVLPDGVHAERSGHYHRYSTDFYLLASLVARRGGDSAAASFEQAALSQSRALRALCDIAGRRPRIGDDDGGQLFPICGRDAGDCADTLATAAAVLDQPTLAVGPAPEETLWLCSASLAVPRSWQAPAYVRSIAFLDAGYCVSRSRDGDHLILDAGPHGYLNGGHAHADALSVVASIGEQPLLIDPGTATYTMDPAMRDRFRSTAMHNTLTIDGRSQSIPHGPFHWESRADASVRRWKSGGTCEYIEASHPGYEPVVHLRGVLAVHRLGWIIIDWVIGHGATTADGYWHVDPAWHLRAVGMHVASARAPDRVVTFIASHRLEHIGPEHPSRLADVSPAYGRIVPSWTLHARARGELPLTMCTWILPHAASVAPSGFEPVPVTQQAGAQWAGAAFHARLDGGDAWVLSAVESESAAGKSPAPRQLWGMENMQTDGRLAFVFAPDGAARQIVIVEGSRLLMRGVELLPATAEVAGIARITLPSTLAPDVHEPAVTRMSN